MHGSNLSVIHKLENTEPLLTAERKLGGMRNLLKLPDSSKFGAGKDPLQLRHLMRKLSARISREPNWPNENPNLPSGYTYLLQFIAHDMVNTSISLAATDGRRFGFENARRQPLTLDTIYGGGPAVSPQAYEFSQICKSPVGSCRERDCAAAACKIERDRPPECRSRTSDALRRSMLQTTESMIVQAPLGVHLPRRLWPTHAMKIKLSLSR
jgi:hypothetical protein